MVRLTKAQLRAIRNLRDRGVRDYFSNLHFYSSELKTLLETTYNQVTLGVEASLSTLREINQKFSLLRRQLETPPRTYRSLRKSAQTMIGCDGAVMVPKDGIFYAIETDGYTHT